VFNILFSLVFNVKVKDLCLVVGIADLEKGNTRGPTQIQLAIPEDNKRATPARKRHETNHYQRCQRVADSGERMRYTPVA
jgi:hypothetical protein